MILRVDFLIETHEELERLVSSAVRHGYLRDEPKRSWTADERKKAARWVLEKQVDAFCKGKVPFNYGG